MCEECKIKQARIDELEDAMQYFSARATNLMSGKPKKKYVKKVTDWQDLMNDTQKNSQEFMAAWNSYLQHRTELKKRLTVQAGKVILETLAQHPINFQVECLCTSVNKGWVGCNPEWVKNTNQNGGGFSGGNKGNLNHHHNELDMQDIF